jgi:hypothetical protein
MRRRDSAALLKVCIAVVVYTAGVVFAVIARGYLETKSSPVLLIENIRIVNPSEEIQKNSVFDYGLIQDSFLYATIFFTETSSRVISTWADRSIVHYFGIQDQICFANLFVCRIREKTDSSLYVSSRGFTVDYGKSVGIEGVGGCPQISKSNPRSLIDLRISNGSVKAVSSLRRLFFSRLSRGFERFSRNFGGDNRCVSRSLSLLPLLHRETNSEYEADQSSYRDNQPYPINNCSSYLSPVSAGSFCVYLLMWVMLGAACSVFGNWLIYSGCGVYRVSMFGLFEIVFGIAIMLFSSFFIVHATLVVWESILALKYEYHEGPKSAERFEKAAMEVFRAGCPTHGSLLAMGGFQQVTSTSPPAPSPPSHPPSRTSHPGAPSHPSTDRLRLRSHPPSAPASAHPPYRSIPSELPH